MGVRAYVIGGYVRDQILGRHSKDIDVVVEGDGPALARRVGERTGSHVAIFARFGTAMIHSSEGEEGSWGRGRSPTRAIRASPA